MNEKVSCAQRLKEALAARNMSQADLCRLTGIKKSAMSQYVNGGLVPRQDRIYVLAQALNVSEAWLMGFEVPMEKSPSSDEDDELYEYLEILRSRPGMRALLSVYKGASDEEIAANVRFIEELRGLHKTDD